MHIALVQPDMVWSDAGKNREMYSRMLQDMTLQADLIIFPEMFTTGFCTDPAPVAETMDGETIRWMRDTAVTLKTSLAGSLIIIENGLYYNRLIYMDPQGNSGQYDKRHLFRMAGEEVSFKPGSKPYIAGLGKWRISFQICYDLRFPVWSRNRNNFDLLVYASNWPAARSDVWNTLLRARAIENQCYVAGVNRVGTDGKGIIYIGESMVIDPKGNVVASRERSAEGLVHATISLDELNTFRNKFPVWKDWDKWNLV